MLSILDRNLLVRGRKGILHPPGALRAQRRVSAPFL